MSQNKSEMLDELIMTPMEAGDPLLNYCQWEYQPLGNQDGKLRPSSLLFLACKLMPMSEGLAETIVAIQHAIGEYRGVFGVKWNGVQLSLEIYIYDYARENRLFDLEYVARFTNGKLNTQIHIPRTIPYFMFSFDLTEKMLKRGGEIDQIHVYIGNPGSNVSSGISYLYTKTNVSMENFYFFFDPNAEMESINAKLNCSVVTPHAETITECLRLTSESIANSQTICIANKKQTNTIYLSGLPVHALKSMIQSHVWPSEIAIFLSEYQSKLAHLQFDIGFDYSLNYHQPTVVRTAFFSSF